VLSSPVLYPRDRGLLQKLKEFVVQMTNLFLFSLFNMMGYAGIAILLFLYQFTG
jgi:hypothetical protein